MLEYRQQEEFYVDDEFGEIPKGWALKKFIKCFEFFPTASYSREQLNETGDCCYIHYGDIHTKFDGFIDFKKDKLPFVDKTMASRFTKLKEGDLIIADASEDYDGVGKAVEVLNIENVDAIAGLHTLHLRAIDDCLVNGFKAYVLNNGAVRNKILRSATGIKVYSISKSSLKNILIPVPPPTEQRTIASILSKVDEAIAATKNSIAKAERLKKALMQNLLTGKLKPDGTWRKEDEFYKDEKFGNVPIGWEVKMVKELAINLDNKRKPIKAEDRHFMKGQYRYYGAAGIIDYIDKYIFEGKYILFGEDGENLLSRKLPQAFIVEGQFWVNNHAHILEPIYNVADIDFLCYQLEFKDYRNIVYGSAQPKINKSDLNKIKILTPNDTKEQKAIADKILTIEKTLENKRNKIQKLERLKKALMQNLLTGKVRVKIKETVNG